MKFTESQLEQAFIHLLQDEKMIHLAGGEMRNIELDGVSEPPTIYGHVVSEKVLLYEDLKITYDPNIQTKILRKLKLSLSLEV